MVDLVVHRRRHRLACVVVLHLEAEEAAQVDGDGVDGVADLHDLRQRVRVVLDHLVDHPVVRRQRHRRPRMVRGGPAHPLAEGVDLRVEGLVRVGARLRLVSCFPVLLDFDVRVLVEDRGGDDERDARVPRREVLGVEVPVGDAEALELGDDRRRARRRVGERERRERGAGGGRRHLVKHDGEADAVAEHLRHCPRARLLGAVGEAEVVVEPAEQ